MTSRPVRGRPTRGALQVRVELARLGLIPGPRPAEIDDGPPGDGLAGFLVALGPVPAAFGRYVSRRGDLDVVSAETRERLAVLCVAGRPRPSSAGVRGRLTAALGSRASELAEVEGTPELWDWSGAWHRARRLDGRRLRLFVPHPDIGGDVDVAMAAVAELVGHLQWPRRLVDDFRADVVAPRIDGAGQRRLWSRLAALDLRCAAAPSMVDDLCGGGVFAVGDPDAEALLAGGPLRARGPAAAQLASATYVELLAHGLLADEAVLARLGDGRALLLDAGLRELPASRRVLEVLRAIAAERLGDVAAAWRVEASAGGVEVDALRSALRQATPRRGGLRHAGESAAEYALAYWRAAVDLGVELGAPWRQAFADLDGLQRRVSAWHPGGDPLADALVEQSWRDGLGRLRSLAGSPRQLGSLVDRYATAFLGAPAALERVLRGPEGGAPAASGLPSPAPSAQPSSGGWADAAALVTALVAVAVVGRRFGDIPGLEAASAALSALLSVAFLVRWWR